MMTKRNEREKYIIIRLKIIRRVLLRSYFNLHASASYGGGGGGGGGGEPTSIFYQKQNYSREI